MADNGDVVLGDDGATTFVDGSLITLSGNTLITGTITETLTDNSADALDVQEGTNNYININTINNNEAIQFGNVTTNPSYSFLGTGTFSTGSGSISLNGATTITGANTFSVGTGTATFGGNILASTGSLNIGSSGTRFGTIYTDNLDATNISGVIVTGSTSSNDWTINSDNATADTENMSLAFERGTITPNATLVWDATSKKFIFNGPLELSSGIGTASFLAPGLITGQAGLTITGAAINLNASSNFATNINTGTSTSTVAIGGNLNTVAIDSSDWDITTTGVATNFDSYNGLVITANTGVITTGTWNGTSIADANVDNNITLNGGTISGTNNTMTLGSDATGDIYYRNSSGYLTRLPIGTSAQVLHGGTIPGYSAIVAADITADSLDFTEFKDLMTLDATTDVAMAGNNFTFSGTGNVGIGTTAPDVTSTLDLTSTSKGFLPPRMTTAQKNAIVTPATGLTIFDTTLNKLNVYNGTAWKNVGSAEIGGEITSGTLGSILFVNPDSVLAQDNANLFWDNANHRLGIGTTGPAARISVLGVDSLSTSFAANISGSTGTGLVVRNDGNVGIGTTDPTQKLTVAGNINVVGGSFIDDGTTLTVPDYVFELGYNLLPIPELEAYLMQNFHLPGVISREQVKTSGMNYGNMIMSILEKTEENTLYAIGNYKNTQNQQLQINGFDNQFNAINNAFHITDSTGNPVLFGTRDTEALRNREMILSADSLILDGNVSIIGNSLIIGGVNLLEKTNENAVNIGTQIQNIAFLQLKTDTNITTIAELKSFTDDNLLIISGKFDEINQDIAENQENLSGKISDQQEQIDNILAEQNTLNLLPSRISLAENRLTLIESVLNYDSEKNLVNILGNIKITGMLEATKIKTEELEANGIVLGEKTMGKGTIPAGETEVTIETDLIDSDSKIYITPTVKLDGRNLYVKETDIVGGTSFKVKLDGETSTENITFNWLIFK